VDYIEVDIKEFVDGKITDLRDIIDTRFDELVHRMEYRAGVTQVALQEAKVELSARLATMNEFRDTIKDLIASFATRIELEALKAATRVELDTVKDQLKHHITRAEHEALATRVEALNGQMNSHVTLSDFHMLKEKYDAIKNQQIVMLIAIIMTLLAVVWDLMIRMK